MEMTLRWYGSAYDTVTLKQIRQIPGVTGVITTLYGKAAGEEWTREEIRALKAEVEEAGLHIAGIESVNVHDAIKAGTAEREQYIKTYIRTSGWFDGIGIYTGGGRRLRPGKDVYFDFFGYERKCDAGLGTGANGTCKRVV